MKMCHVPTVGSYDKEQNKNFYVESVKSSPYKTFNAELVVCIKSELWFRVSRHQCRWLVCCFVMSIIRE